MFCLAVASCLFVAVFGLDYRLNSNWDAFKITYNKRYGTSEEILRRQVWEDNVRFIQKHNLEAVRGIHTFTVGMNEYGDMTAVEFASKLNGFRYNKTSFSVCTQYIPPVDDLPDSVDWRKEGYVTPVKIQGQCGSCWSFSATGALEGQNFKKTGKLTSLSEKNLIDCSGEEGNYGCEGGLMDLAFAYVIKNKGIDTEESYPYKPKDGKCHFKQKDIGATETGCQDIKHESEEDLQKAVANVGPISVGIDASHSSFQLYKSGVYNERRCSSTQLDHGVLVVGYGTERSSAYWLVKNSWGPNWGQKGYILMSRNKTNQCGIATAASFPTM